VFLSPHFQHSQHLLTLFTTIDESNAKLTAIILCFSGNLVSSRIQFIKYTGSPNLGFAIILGVEIHAKRD